MTLFYAINVELNFVHLSSSQSVNMTLIWKPTQAFQSMAINEKCLAFDFTYKFESNGKSKLVWAGIILILVYGLIIFEVD